VLLPLLLILVAAFSSGVVAYGTYPLWMRFPHGLDIILWSRRLEWPLVSLSIIACILLIALTLSRRRQPWWLIGLAPVLALFAHRFSIGPQAGRLAIVDNPAFVAADQAALADGDWVVGITFDDEHFAYPYSALFNTPVVIQADHEKRLMLLWSAYANRALAVPIGQELKAHDLEIVSTPANALLLYNSRHGQFINGLTGATPSHEKPAGFANGLPIVTSKMTWKAWHAMYPETRVFSQTPVAGVQAPTQPIEPAWPTPLMILDRPVQTRVTLFGITEPIVVESSLITAAPLNSRADGIPIALFRETAGSPICAFDRRIYDKENKLDLIVDLAPNLNHRLHPTALFVDLGSNSGWNGAGVCVDAPSDAKYLKGKRLSPVEADDDLPWGVIKFWYPDLKLEIPPAAPIAIDAPQEDTPAPTPARHKKRTRISTN
jgi:hypothetical protein